jgi:hypothetical protein
LPRPSAGRAHGWPKRDAARLKIAPEGRAFIQHQLIGRDALTFGIQEIGHRRAKPACGM